MYKPCPFCPDGGEIILDDDIGTSVDLGCVKCGVAKVSIQISDLMTYEEKKEILFDMKTHSYPREFVDRAIVEAKRIWNIRAKPEVKKCRCHNCLGIDNPYPEEGVNGESN